MSKPTFQKFAVPIIKSIMLAIIVRVNKRTKHWFVSQSGPGRMPEAFIHSVTAKACCLTKL